MEGEKAEAARVYNDNPDEREDIRIMLDDEQWAELWDGMRKAIRQSSGNEEAYKGLSDRQKEAVDVIQSTDLLEVFELSDQVEEWSEKSREAISALSEDEREELRSALPDRAERVFERVRSGVGQDESGPSEDQDQSEDQDRDRGRGRGGYGGISR